VESTINNLRYFYEAALINSADIFGYLPFMVEHRRAFEAIGAKGCLAALDQLMPFYAEQQKLASENEKRAYWDRTRAARASAEALAETPDQFGRLLLRYAQQNASKIGSD
jgi:hypothetical protein